MQEGKDKQFLLTKINDLQGKQPTADKQRKAKNAYIKQESVNGSVSKISTKEVSISFLEYCSSCSS